MAGEEERKEKERREEEGKGARETDKGKKGRQSCTLFAFSKVGKYGYRT